MKQIRSEFPKTLALLTMDKANIHEHYKATNRVESYKCKCVALHIHPTSWNAHALHRQYITCEDLHANLVYTFNYALNYALS